jgi:hypothetical protein
LIERKIGFDYANLDQKILIDDENYLVMPAVIASEIVHQYEDGWAYKPADELEKMAKTASDIGTVPIKILEHPGADTDYLLLRPDDVYGRAENFQYVKNLLDPQTRRPMRRGVRADIRWFKDRVPPDIIEKIRSFTLHDVSIGFAHEKDMTPGDWNGTHYDYVQRNIFLNHIAAPIPQGRCPGPVCGIGFDKATKVDIPVGIDKVEKRGNQWCVVHCHGEEAGQVIKCFDTEEEAMAMHRAIEAQKQKDQGEKPPEDWFANCKAKVLEANSSYSEEQANAVCGDIWANKPEQRGIGDCPICQAIKEVGMPTAAKRLAIAYGVDILSVIKNEPKPKPSLPETDLDKQFNESFGQLKALLDRPRS